jgi:hypothetical protein
MPKLLNSEQFRTLKSACHRGMRFFSLPYVLKPYAAAPVLFASLRLKPRLVSTADTSGERFIV